MLKPIVHIIVIQHYTSVSENNESYLINWKHKGIKYQLSLNKYMYLPNSKITL